MKKTIYTGCIAATLVFGLFSFTPGKTDDPPVAGYYYTLNNVTPQNPGAGPITPACDDEEGYCAAYFIVNSSGQLEQSGQILKGPRQN